MLSQTQKITILIGITAIIAITIILLEKPENEEALHEKTDFSPEISVIEVLYKPIAQKNNEITIRIENLGSTPVEISEFNVESYLGEILLDSTTIDEVIKIDGKSQELVKITIFKDGLINQITPALSEEDWKNPSENIFARARKFDVDGDYIKDKMEIYWFQSDPNKIDTDEGGMDDYNEVFTWGLDPTDLEDDKRFIENIPNVGGARSWELFQDGNPEEFTIEQLIEVSKRDPYIQWLADHTDIRWENNSVIGKVGYVYVNNEPILNSLENLYSHKIQQPSFYFSHGRKGNCIISAHSNAPIFQLMGYQTIFLEGENPKLCESLAWNEVYIEDEIYV